MSSRYHRLLIYDVKRTNKIDSMGPFNLQLEFYKALGFHSWLEAQVLLIKVTVINHFNIKAVSTQKPV